jgi:O-antigen/teichoic acid export membrane protein
VIKSLKMLTAKGSIVMAATMAVARSINVIAVVVLARLLDPRDFGIVALASILVAATDLFAGLGMGNALIHSQEDRRKASFQAFVVTFLFSFFLFLLVFANASFFADLLGDSEVAPVIRWMSTLILFDALFLVPNALLSKDLMFAQVSKAMLIALFVYNGVAIGLALLGFGLWSLVYAELARSISKLVAVAILCPGWDWLKPKAWDWKIMRGLFRYGIQSTGSGFLSFLNTNWDDWLVGRVLGSTALGYYSKAYNLSNKGIVDFNRRVVSSVFFPSYSKIQDDKGRLSRAYLKGLGMVALALSPLAMGLLVVAAEAVPIVLGEKWLPMVPALQVYTFMALVRPLSGSTSPLFLAVGRPDYNLRVGLLQLGIMVPLVLLLLARGIVGVAIGVTTAYILGFFFNVYQMHRIMPGIAPKMIRAILPALFASGVMMLAVLLSKGPLLRLVGGQHNLISLLAMIAVGAVVYILVAFLIQRELILEAASLLADVFRARKRMAFSGG